MGSLLRGLEHLPRVAKFVDLFFVKPLDPIISFTIPTSLVLHSQQNHRYNGTKQQENRQIAQDNAVSTCKLARVCIRSPERATCPKK